MCVVIGESDLQLQLNEFGFRLAVGSLDTQTQAFSSCALKAESWKDGRDKVSARLQQPRLDRHVLLQGPLGALPAWLPRQSRGRQLLARNRISHDKQRDWLTTSPVRDVSQETSVSPGQPWPFARATGADGEGRR